MVVTGVPPAVIARVVDVVAGAARTATTREAEALRAPEVPLRAAVAEPGMADGLAVRFRVLVPVVELGEMVAVTPLGRPDTARLTVPLNPFCGITVIEIGRASCRERV